MSDAIVFENYRKWACSLLLVLLKKINDFNCKGYVDEKLKELMYKDPCCTKAIIHFLNLKA